MEVEKVGEMVENGKEREKLTKTKSTSHSKEKVGDNQSKQ